MKGKGIVKGELNPIEQYGRAFQSRFESDYIISDSKHPIQTITGLAEFVAMFVLFCLIIGVIFI